MLTLYDFLSSGNGYKVRLLLTQLGLAFRYVDVDVIAGETRQADYLAINPNGRIPALRFEDGRILSESNAILFHMARDTSFLPADPFEQAQVLQWMFFEQYDHEPNVAVARFWLHLQDPAPYEALLPEKHEKGYRALGVMEKRLAEAPFLVGGRYSIADIALYAYTHVCDEGGFDLAAYPAIRAWLSRVADQPGHILITQSTFD